MVYYYSELHHGVLLYHFTVRGVLEPLDAMLVMMSYRFTNRCGHVVVKRSLDGFSTQLKGCENERGG